MSYDATTSAPKALTNHRRDNIAMHLERDVRYRSVALTSVTRQVRSKDLVLG